jgi:hypothetical protein
MPDPVMSTLNVALDWFPWPSDAVQVTVWCPIENRLPDGGLQLTVAPPLI